MADWKRPARLKRKRGKMLGGQAPRRGGRWQRPGRRKAARTDAVSILGTLALAMFVVGVVGGFAWALDRQLRGGILRQTAEARQRPDQVSLAELPPYVADAFASVVEPGLLRTGRLRRGESGRTVAGELVRQVHLLPANLGGEARALTMGPLLEQRTSRTRLLEMFLNRVYLGEEKGYPVYGVWYAAQEYFEKEPAELTLSEAATLAGLLLPPRITEPRRAVGAVGARRNEVLEVMLRGELISPEDYRQAIAEALPFQPGPGEMPMTRPPDWTEEPEVIRLPEELRVYPDSLPQESE